MTDTIRDLLEIAQRVEQLRAAPPAPLPLHLYLRQRDGPREYPASKPAPERATGPYSTSQRHPRQSKGFTHD